MRFLYIAIISLTIFSSSCVSQAKECANFEGKKDPAYRRKVAGAYRELMNNKPNMYNLIRVANGQQMTPEELIAIADKDNSCDLSKKELMAFL